MWSLPFRCLLRKYQEIDDFHDHTTHLLEGLATHGRLKYLVDAPKFVSEATARNYALEHLKKHNVDYIWLVDSDEFYTEGDIEEN